MQIKCPECGFSRAINPSQIPQSSSFATCPKCATRFRFRAEPEPMPESPLPDASAQHLPESPKDGDIWASMDKMRQEWEEIDREENNEDRGAPSPEDEARLREEADRAYRQAAAQGGKVPFLSSMGSVPWEYKGGFLNPALFVRTCMLMIMRSPQFFAGINPFSSVFPAWIFLLLVSSVEIGVLFNTPLMPIAFPDGTLELKAPADLLSLPLFISSTVFMITIKQFLASFVINYIIRLHSGAKANFRLTFKVLAYADMPLLLWAFPVIGMQVGNAASLALLFLGIRYAYGFSWRQTIISVVPYLVLMFLFAMTGMLTAVSLG